MITRIHVRLGERVYKGQVLLEVETDVIVMEVRAPYAGVVQAVRFNEGDELPPGAAVVELGPG